MSTDEPMTDDSQATHQALRDHVLIARGLSLPEIVITATMARAGLAAFRAFIRGGGDISDDADNEDPKLLVRVIYRAMRLRE